MSDPAAVPASAAAAPPKASAAFFQRAIKNMVDKKGSDLLLKVGRAPTVRVAGELEQMDMPPLTPADLKALAEQIMQPRQLKEFMETKEADFAIGVPGVGRFRVNVYWQRGTLAFAFRVIPYEVKTIEEDGVLSIRPNLRALFRQSGAAQADVDLWKGSWMQVRAQE